MFYYVRPYIQFKSINKSINDGYNRKTWHEYHYINNNTIQIILGLGYFIGLEKYY